MQNGSVIRRTRKKHSDIWQFRWWEETSDGKRVYRRREIGAVEQIPSGMRRLEFCGSHEMAVSTLAGHLKKQRSKQM